MYLMHMEPYMQFADYGNYIMYKMAIKKSVVRALFFILAQRTHAVLVHFITIAYHLEINILYTKIQSNQEHRTEKYVSTW